MARDQQAAANRAANAARTRAAEQIRTVPRLPGGAPVPITVTAGDTALANGILPAVASAPTGSWSDPGAELRSLAGGPLSPAQVMAVYRAAQAEARKQKGSVINRLGGLVNTDTLGLVSFGNPNTSRYHGGQLAAMIPVIDLESLVVDGEKLGATAIQGATSTSRTLTADEQVAAQQWRDGLVTKSSPTGTPAYDYEIAQTGDRNIQMQGTGADPISADGFDSAHATILRRSTWEARTAAHSSRALRFLTGFEVRISAR